MKKTAIVNIQRHLSPLMGLGLILALPACADGFTTPEDGVPTGRNITLQAQSAENPNTQLTNQRGTIPSTFLGALLTVGPDEFTTIQDAIDAAESGDVVQITAGSYQENLTLKSNITLTGAPGSATVLYGTIQSVGASNVTVQNLVIDGLLLGKEEPGLLVDGGSIHLERLRVRDVSYGLWVPGQSAEEQPSVTIDRCHFEGAEYAGIRVERDIDLHVTNSVFLYHGFDAVELEVEGFTASISIRHSLFFGNGLRLSDGSAIWSIWDGVVLVNNIITANNVGISCTEACESSHSVVWGNFIDFVGLAYPTEGHIHRDPRLMAPSEGDFSLRFDSPAIDVGKDDGDLDHDFNGTPRPLGDGIDIGPFEYPAPLPDLTLAITEIMANPIDEGKLEYVELKNFGDVTVDAAGLVLDDGDATDVVAGWNGGTTLVEPGAYAVILDPDYDGTYDIPSDALLLTVAETSTLGSGLSNNDTVRIWSWDGLLPVDAYSFPFNAGNGVSVEKDSIEDGDTLGNWVASPCGHTPGAENCASQPPNISKEVLIAINELMTNPVDEQTGEFIELYNFGWENVELAGLVISDGDTTDVLVSYQGQSTLLEPGGYAIILDPDFQGDYDIPSSAMWMTVESSATLGNGLAVNDPISILHENGMTVIDTYTHFFNPGNGISIEKVDPTIGDIPSNYVSSTCGYGASPGKINCVMLDGVDPVDGATIAIMEVMANPLDEDRDEYIELLNYGMDAVDLAGFRISDGDKEESLQAFTEEGSTLLGPGQYALILDAEYAGTYPIPEEALLLTTGDTSIGTGLSTNDPLRLRAAKGAKAVDTFAFPFNPGNGLSVEKIDLVVGDVPQNWLASPCQASPGLANCATPDGDAQGTISTTAMTVSEVMANPLVESTGEYVELFNAGPVGIDVNGWKLSDGDSTDTLVAWESGSTLVAPGQFAVVVDSDYPGTYNIPAGVTVLTTSDKSLGNGLTTSDGVTLYESDGVTLVASFSFPFNAGNGKSVEKLVLMEGDLQANWATSTCRVSNGDSNDFASPGRRNCADPNGETTLTQALGESCPSGAGDCLSGLCAIDLLNSATFCSQDCANSPCPAGFECQMIWDVNYTDVCVPVGGGAIPEVFINEVLYDGEGADKDVFVELYGTPDTILDGLLLIGINGSNGSTYHAIELTGMIGPDGYFVIAHPGANGGILDVADMTTLAVDYQNGPDSIQLLASGHLIDAVGYGDFSADEVFAGEGTGASDASAGQSLGRSNDGVDTDDNGVDFVVFDTPTPGAANTF